MRRQFVLFMITAAAITAIMGSEAFSSVTTGARAVSASVVGDSAAYLSLTANSTSPHKVFVSEAGTGKLTINFASATGVTGTGVNAGSQYYFDNLIEITNQGTQTVYVQAVTASPFSVCLQALIETTCSTNSVYAATHPATSRSLAVGGVMHMGIGVDSTASNSGASHSGSITVYACRAATGTCSVG